MSRTGRTSTNEPGRNARIPSTSTVKPPLTFPVITPITVSLSSQAFSRRTHASWRLAFSRDSKVSPKPSSIASKATSMISPTLTSISPLSDLNCSTGMAASDFRPASTITTSFRTATTVPLTMAPGRVSMALRLSSNNCAKFSVIFTFSVKCSTLHHALWGC